MSTAGGPGPASASPLAAAPSFVEAPFARAALLTLLLATAGLGRWAAASGGLADGIVVGALFGAVLVAGVALVGWRPAALPWRQLVTGVSVGLAGAAALLVLALATRWPGPWLPFHPAGSFVTWAAVTVLVASAEELVLRGALFDALDNAGGPVAALLLTAAAFALLHVPSYGWYVVPLDFGVGLFLGGLRLWTGGVAAPAVAHVVADLATWWI
jgi:membrane protease YdiL (CAAX protease family)